MENKQQQMEERLWDYLDGLSSMAERTSIEQLIATDPQWASKYEELRGIGQLIQDQELEQPSMRFTKNVMEEIARFQVAPATKSYINKNIIHGIAAFFLIMITGVLVYFLSQINWHSHGDTSTRPWAKLDIGNQTLEKINFGKYLSGPYLSIFILLTVIAALVLLDSYLRKRQHGH